jgi:hypothetical protein
MFKCLFAPCLGYLQEEDLHVNLTFCTRWIDLQSVWWLNIVAAFRCLMWSEPLNGLKSFAWRDLAIFQEIWLSGIGKHSKALEPQKHPCLSQVSGHLMAATS